MMVSRGMIFGGLLTLVFGTAFISGDTNPTTLESELKREQLIYRVAFDTYAKSGYLEQENFKAYMNLIKKLRESDSFR